MESTDPGVHAEFAHSVEYKSLILAGISGIFDLWTRGKGQQTECLGQNKTFEVFFNHFLTFLTKQPEPDQYIGWP